MHGAAVGVHRQDLAAAVALAVVGLAQLGWGLVALWRTGRATAGVGVAIGAVALGGWVLAKTRGIGAIAGLDRVEAIQWSDATAAGLALASLVLALRQVAAGATRTSAPRPALLRGAFVGLALVAMAAMVAAPGHAHRDHDDGDHSGGHGSHGPGAVAATAYDPSRPIDLSGAPTVTAEQQARAERLVARTLAGADRFTDRADAEARGYTSTGDAASGDEHLVRWEAIDDDVALDPEEPEGLVYRVADDGAHLLVAVTYLLPERTPLASVPDVGGALTVWKLRADLCRDPDGGAGSASPQVRGRTDAAGACGPGLVPVAPVPELVVWVVANPCGPFVAPSATGAEPCPTSGGG